MKIGNEATRFLTDVKRQWKQGEHMLISGGTGSGKTYLARQLLEQRAGRQGGTHLVFVCKLQPDETITKEYKGYRRWTEWKKKPSVDDKRILLWPDVDKCTTIREMRLLQQEVFDDALNQLARVGKWTVQIDEGQFFCDILGLGQSLSVLYTMGRSSRLSMCTLTQRPAFLPLNLYANSTHVFAAQTRLTDDLKRLAALGSHVSQKTRNEQLSGLGDYDFLYIGSKASTLDDRVVNLSR